MSLEREVGGTRVIVLISALLAMAGAIFGGKNLTGLKPEHPVFARDEAKGEGAPDEVGPASHIWNDPFQRSIHHTAVDSPSVLTRFSEHEEVSTQFVRLLCCLLDGSPFPENIDDRRRTRVALHGAMLRMGYAPESGQSLRTVRFWHDENRYLTFPYERFYKFNEREKHWVVCLYIDEGRLGDAPIKMLDNVKRWVSLAVPTNSVSPVQLDQTLSVLGPSNSLRALEFLGEANQRFGSISVNTSGAINCYMPAASVGRGTLLSWLPESIRKLISGNGEQDFRFAVGAVPVQLRRAPSDQMLTKELVRELTLRGVLKHPRVDGDPPQAEASKRSKFAVPDTVKRMLPRSVAALIEPSEQRILIIAEQDSPYGRALHEEVRSAIAKQNPNQIVNTYWFPRGLDGYTPQSDAGIAARGLISSSMKNAAKGSPSMESVDPRGSMGHGTKAFGDSMLDYLERLRIDLSDKNASNRGPRISAVVVLCNDVFDKVMILKALRPWFRNTWFLTTDMDAQFLQRDNIDATHNLVVASSLDISSGQIVSSASPGMEGGRDRFRQFPYRSAAQMSTYQGVLNLLDASTFKLPAQARMYEIGLNGPIPIGRDFPGLVRYMGWLWLVFLAIALFIFFPYPSNPFRQVTYTAKSLVLVAVALADIWLQRKVKSWWSVARSPNDSLLVPIARKAYAELVTHTFPYYLALLQLAVAYGLGLGVCLWVFLNCRDLTSDPNEEHFYWTAGVSVWPTEIFRAALITLCLYWYARIVFRQATRVEEIEKDFPDLLETSFAPKRGLSIAGLFGRLLKELLTIFWGNWRFEGKRDTNACWQEYKQATGVFPTLLRCSVTTYLMTLLQLGVLAVAFGDRHVPIRGLKTIEFDGNLTTLLVLGLSLVASVVIDCAMMSSHAIHVFAEKPSDWTKTIVKRYHNLNIGEPSDRLIDLAVVGRITDTVLQHSYFLYLLLLGTMLSRIFFFDNWNWSPFVIQFFASYFLLVLAAEYFLAHQCNRIRNRTIEDCETRLLAAVSPEREQLQQICAQIRGMQTGGFRSFSENPVARAVLVPLGGASAVGLLQYVALWTW